MKYILTLPSGEQRFFCSDELALAKHLELGGELKNFHFEEHALNPKHDPVHWPKAETNAQRT